MYRNTTGKDLTSTEIETRLKSSSSDSMMLDNVVVDAIGMENQILNKFTFFVMYNCISSAN